MNIESISLDQLRAVIAVVETGSFTSAARRLRRVQSAVSQSVSVLEQQLGVVIFDRSGYRPRLTPAGESLLASIRAIIERSDRLRAEAKYIASGLEPELGVVLDAVYPIKSFTEVLAEFRETFPSVTVRLYVEALGGVVEKVMDGTCAVGILATLPELPQGVIGHPLPPVPLIPVVAPSHPLARIEGLVTWEEVQEHIQIVLSDRSKLTDGRDFFVLSSQTWRVADLSSKHELLLAGLGWGTMPIHMIASDLADGTLRQMTIEKVPETDLLRTFAFHQGAAVLGPAGTWMLERLISRSGASLAPEAPAGKGSPSSGETETII